MHRVDGEFRQIKIVEVKSGLMCRERCPERCPESCPESCRMSMWHVSVISSIDETLSVSSLWFYGPAITVQTPASTVQTVRQWDIECNQILVLKFILRRIWKADPVTTSDRYQLRPLHLRLFGLHFFIRLEFNAFHSSRYTHCWYTHGA